MVWRNEFEKKLTKVQLVAVKGIYTDMFIYYLNFEGQRQMSFLKDSTMCNDKRRPVSLFNIWIKK